MTRTCFPISLCVLENEVEPLKPPGDPSVDWPKPLQKPRNVKGEVVLGGQVQVRVQPEMTFQVTLYGVPVLLDPRRGHRTLE